MRFKKTITFDRDEQFKQLHEHGAKAFGAKWLRMNIFIIETAAAFQSMIAANGFNCSKKEERLLLTMIAHKVCRNVFKEGKKGRKPNE